MQTEQVCKAISRVCILIIFIIILRGQVCVPEALLAFCNQSVVLVLESMPNLELFGMFLPQRRYVLVTNLNK